MRLADRRHSRIETLMEIGQLQGRPVPLPASAWSVDKIAGPNITDKQTVVSFARMASNAYVTNPLVPGWKDVGMGFNNTEPFGWEQDGLRGHVFTDAKNKTVVIAMKGTSVSWFDGSGSERRDKENDNLFFSCCCGQGGSHFWRQVCDCMSDETYTCNATCVVSALRKKNHYYNAGVHVYKNVTAMYPDAQIWLTGHSLGGSTGSLVALTYGVPAVTFEAPGEAMPASRLGLPTPPGYRIGGSDNDVSQGTVHFGHTADPIYMGSTKSAASLVSIAGFAMESECHTGVECVYDTVKDLGWSQGLTSHRISIVLRDVVEAYDTVPKCTPRPDCVDCFNWKYFNSNGTEPRRSSTSSSTSSPTSTSTETCKTPGFWGCLDKTTTTSSSTSSPTKATYTITSTTCLTPGEFFGCRVYSTTTYTSISKASTTRAPTITTTSSGTATSTSTSMSTSTSTSTTCRRNFFFPCKPSPDESPWSGTASSTPSITSTPLAQIDL